jgi:hypothetical protein
MQKTIVQIFCPLLFTFSLFAQQAQKPATNEGRALTLDINYGYATPGGDLKDRFGNSFDVGLGFDLLTNNNWIIGLGGGIIFGNKVKDKEDVLANFRTPEGQIIGGNASWAAFSLKERGFHTEARFGKLVPLLSDNKRSGLRLVLGLGFLQHKIRLQDDPQSQVAQTIGDYSKGYDRLTNGLMLSQFIGYQHLSKNKLINFYGGFESTQGFTQNRRDYDFLTRQASDKSDRLDLLFGFKIGWILPFYISSSYADNIRY